MMECKMDIKLLSEIFLDFLSPILLLLIATMGKVYLAKFERTSKEYNQKICSDNQKIIDYFQMNLSNDTYIKKLYEVKNHFNHDFVETNLKNAMNEKANKFIETVENTLEHYDINIANLKHIIDEFTTARSYIRHRLEYYLGLEKSENFNKLLDQRFAEFINGVEDILTETNNHYKEKFICLCSHYLKTFIKDMRDLL